LFINIYNFYKAYFLVILVHNHVSRFGAKLFVLKLLPGLNFLSNNIQKGS